jgi:DNA ligase-1
VARASRPGETARLAQQRRLPEAGLVPFRPVKFMLASPAESAAEIWERTVQHVAAVPSAGAGIAGVGAPAACLQHAGRTRVWLEDKYDGVCCQLHKVSHRVALYSRDLKDITGTFFDIADAARQLPGDVILDGEILAMRFPRIARIRADKSPAEIDTVAAARRLVKERVKSQTQP